MNNKMDHDISWILDLAKEFDENNEYTPFFISGWEIDYKNKYLNDLLKKSFVENIQLSYNYVFMDEIAEFKKNIQYLLGIMTENNYTISHNGTVAMNLILNTFCNDLKCINSLIITPTYFITYEVMKQLKSNIFLHNLDDFNNYDIDIQNIRDMVIRNNIQMIIITDPIFGTGVEISISKYAKLVDLCNTYNVSLIIDYVYGGLNWTTRNQMLNKELLSIMKNCNSFAFIESVSKKLGLNGLKSAIIFGDKKTIQLIEKKSVHLVGGLCFNQLTLLEELFSYNNIEIIEDQINTKLRSINAVYKLIRTMTLGSCWTVSPSTSGIFSSLIHNKYSYKDIDEKAVTEKILNEIGLMIIPSSRYLSKKSNKFSFRINLAKSRNDILTYLDKLINTDIDFF